MSDGDDVAAQVKGALKQEGEGGTKFSGEREEELSGGSGREEEKSCSLCVFFPFNRNTIEMDSIL